MQYVHGHPLELAGTELHGSCHACVFFDSRDKEYELLVPFAKEGFERGEKGFHILDPSRREEVLGRLGDVEPGGRLDVLDWNDTHLRDDRFDQQAMITLISDVLSAAAKAGYPSTRIWANMGWAVHDFRGIEDLVEYEARLNHLLPKHPHAMICAYDLSRFDAGVVIDILRTHPQVIISGVLQENPFYVPADEFLPELRERSMVHLPDQSVA